MTVHSSITSERVCALIESDDNVGLCLECGAEQYNCEPDARHYECEECGEHQVFGVEQILIEVTLPDTP
jgi:hypothetical protein